MVFWQEFSGIQLGYQGFDIWYPKLKTGTVMGTRIPPISNPVYVQFSIDQEQCRFQWKN